MRADSVAEVMVQVTVCERGGHTGGGLTVRRPTGRQCTSAAVQQDSDESPVSSQPESV